MNGLLAMPMTVFAAVTLILGGGTAASAAPTSDTGTITKIIFADQGGGIWVVKADGSGLHEVNPAQARSVSFAPDGVRYAYTAAGAVWTASTAGGTRHRLTVADGTAESVAWSPNGKWLAYAKDVGTGEDIFRVPAGGGASQRITSGAAAGCVDTSPAWSPDSSTIAYDRESEGAPSCPASGLVVQRAGQKAQIVVPGPLLDYSGGPSFTPTGNLTYIAQCDVDNECGSDAAGYIAGADSSNQTIVAPNTDCQAGDECLEGMIGAPRARGWLANYDYAESDDPNSFHEACFQGGYQKAGTVTLTPPSFCISNMTPYSYDAT